jgi:ElaB/YqjD/DUF883 family membrane-anchored ribosome-binding protein
MRLTTIARNLSMAAILGVFTAGAAMADTRDPATEGTQLINRLEESARNLRSDVADLQSFSNVLGISSSTHYGHLDRIKSRVNGDLRSTTARLEEIQAELPAWQQDAVDKLLLSSIALAQDTDAAIRARNDAGSTPALLDAEYQDLLSRMYRHSETLVKTSDAAGAYADAYRKALAAELAVPES